MPCRQARSGFVLRSVGKSALGFTPCLSGRSVQSIVADGALAGAHGSGFDLCLAGKAITVVGREARDLSAASSSGGSKL